ncbi:MAG TPA: hypothetical protein VGD87_12705, partial [Archangium sp.]
VACILLAHSTDEGDGRKSPSSTSGVQGGKALGRDARLRLDLSEKNGQLRVTIAKNTMGRHGTVLEFERLAEAGLVKADSGVPIDVAAESSFERKKKLLERAKESREVTKQLKAAEKEAEPEPDAQPSLDLGGSDGDR